MSNGNVLVIPEGVKNIQKVQFTGKDFDTLVDDLVNFMRQRFPATVFNNFVASELGVMLIETIAFAVQDLMFFLDRQATETFLETAELRTSVERLARQIGFKLTGATPSVVTVSIALDDPQAFEVVLEEGTALSTVRGLTYVLGEKVTFPAGDVGPKTVSAFEGTFAQDTFISTGEAKQVFRLTQVPEGKFLASGLITVTVDGVKWDVKDFLEFEATNQVEVAFTTTPPEIRFGDGIAGNIPPRGAEIAVRYLVTAGSAGKIGPNEILGLAIPLVVNFTEIPVIVVNTAASTPGSDAISLDKVRTLAPKVFATAKRAVTMEDYNALVNAFVDPLFGAVAKGRARIIRGIDEDTNLLTFLNNLTATKNNVFGTVKTSVLNEIQTQLTAEGVSTAVINALKTSVGNIIDAQQAAIHSSLDAIILSIRNYWNTVVSGGCKANVVQVSIMQADARGRLIPPNVGLMRKLKEFLESQKEATVDVVVISGANKLFHVSAVVSIKVLPNFSEFGTREAVKLAVENYLVSRNFGEGAKISDVYRIVDGTSGVDFANITLSVDEGTILPDSFGNINVPGDSITTLGTVTVNLMT